MIDAPEDTDDLTQVHVRSWRRMWLATSMHELRCSAGHRLRDPLILDHGCIRCRSEIRAKIASGEWRGTGQECGNLVYVIAGLATPRGAHVILCAEVNASDMRQMAEQHMGIDEIVAFLGIVL